MTDGLVGCMMDGMSGWEDRPGKKKRRHFMLTDASVAALDEAAARIGCSKSFLIETLIQGSGFGPKAMEFRLERLAGKAEAKKARAEGVQTVRHKRGSAAVAERETQEELDDIDFTGDFGG